MKPRALLTHVTRELGVVVLALLAVALSACGGGGDGSNAQPVAADHQAASAPSSSGSQPSSTPIAVTWPTPTGGPARIFDYASAAAPVSDYTRASRFVLYDNGTFELQLAEPGSGRIFAYTGRYSEGSSVVTFDWDGWSSAGPWGATATLDGKSLAVQYNVIMQLTDFDNAVYVLVP